jgi:hypothetical protein
MLSAEKGAMLDRILRLWNSANTQDVGYGIELLRGIVTPELLTILWEGICLGRSGMSWVPSGEQRQGQIMAGLLEMTPLELLRQQPIVARLRHLELSGSVVPCWSKLAAFPRLRHVRLIDMPLRSLPSVQRLTLMSCELMETVEVPEGVEVLTLRDTEPRLVTRGMLDRLELHLVDLSRYSSGISACVLIISSCSAVTDLRGFAGLRRLVLETHYVDELPVMPLLPETVEELGFHQDAGGTMDISSLAGLSALRILEMYNQKVVSLAPLAGAHALQLLSLQELPDLSPLVGLRNIRRIEGRGAAEIPPELAEQVVFKDDDDDDDIPF